MKLFLISSKKNPNINNLLKKACQQNKIVFSLIYEDEFDYTNPPNTGGHLLYSASTTKRAMQIEQKLLTKTTSSFHINNNGRIVFHNAAEQSYLFEQSNIPIPKTIRCLPKTAVKLEKYVHYLGGFPIIVKSAGGSHGVGVMKIDSLSSLTSISDFLHSNTDNTFIMMQFIKTSSSARLIVLGDRVIDSIKYFTPENEFRSNVGNLPQVQPQKYSKEIQETAVKATHSIGAEFGGVDILEDEYGHYVAEVNFPCNFSRAQMLTRVDITDQMIKYLIQKSRQLV